MSIHLSRTRLARLAPALTVLLALLGLPVVGPATGAAAQASPASDLQPFVRTWSGHDRVLVLRADHRVRESVASGCCSPVIDLRLHVSRPHGDTRHGWMRARVTMVHVYPHSGLPADRRPHVGDTGRIRVRGGVLHEPFSQTFYCTPAAGRHGTCGA